MHSGQFFVDDAEVIYENPEQMWYIPWKCNFKGEFCKFADLGNATASIASSPNICPIGLKKSFPCSQ